MTDPSRIAAWLDARAPHDALLSGTTDEIIVALLTRIEALEVSMNKWNNIEWTPEQMAVLNQIKLDAARELADAEQKWHDRLNAALRDAAVRLENERVAWNKQRKHDAQWRDE